MQPQQDGDVYGDSGSPGWDGDGTDGDGDSPSDGDDGAWDTGYEYGRNRDLLDEADPLQRFGW